MKPDPRFLPVPLLLLKALRYFPGFAKVFFRLFRDRRVSVFAKIIPVIMFIWILPFDFDWLPALGWIDDLIILLVGSRLFIRLCPADVVAEHVRAVALESASPDT